MLKAEKRLLDRLYVRFTISAAVVITAFLLRQSMVQYIGMDLPPFITFYPAVMVAATLAGFWPGLLATALASLLADYWIFEPRGHFAIASSSDAVGLAFFAGMGVFMSVVAEGYRRNQRRIAAYKREQAQRENDEKLRQSEEQFETLANAIPQLCWMANPDGFIFWYNQRWYSYTGTTPKQMEGWGWQSVHDPETLPKVLEQWQGSIASGEPFDMVFPLRGADGVFRPFLTRVMPVKDADGKVVRWFGTNTDISAQKQVEAELRKSKERLALAVEVADLGEWELDLKDHTSIRSLRHDQIFGYKELLPEWTYGMFLDHVLPDCRAGVEEKFKASTVSGTWDFETQVRAADEKVRWIWARGLSRQDETGKTTRMAGTVMDITERKLSEARLRRFYETDLFAILYWSIDGGVVDVNDKFLQMTGYTREDVRTGLLNWAQMTPPEYQAMDEDARRQIKDTGIHLPYEKEFIRKDGTRVWGLFSAAAWEDNRNEGVSFILDVTARKLAEEALRASEKRWATTLQSIGDAVISTDAAGHVEFMNDVAQKLTGWPIAEAKGRALDEIFDIVQEVTRIKPESPVAKVIRLGKVVGLANHTILIGRDGTEIPIDDSAAPIRDRNDLIQGVVLVFHDVSEQRLAERALRESDRLATTGRLAATIAHEIHNPLDAVGNLLHLIGQGTKEDCTREFASMAGQELVRITQMTQQMLTFQREAAKPIPVKIREILDNVLALYERKIKSAGITLEQEIEFDNDILALPGELRQMFANLVGNAIEAVGSRRGTITLRAYSSQDWRYERPGLRVVVADDGPGIPADVRSRIFEPFFTTKGESGTGLGLWITSDILRKYEGTMRLRTSTQPSSSGTCFSVFLPFGTGPD